MSPSVRFACRLFLLTLVSGRAETVKDREGAVRADRAAWQGNSRWIYNDVDRGFAEAAKSGKPLLVVLRCVPCLACKGMDAAVLESPGLQPLLDPFVLVRVINANALDLTRFQFDYDLSFSTLFFNADGTVYGRYGSWVHQRDANDVTLDGYRAALEAVLRLHQAYPGNKAELAGKQGGPAPFRVPVEIPALAKKFGRELDWDGKVVQSCVHCHQIGDAFRTSYRDQGRVIPPELIYPMPPPETIGLQLDPRSVARVAGVVPASAASRAGFQPGDVVLAANGSPLVSGADLAWALHRSPEAGQIRLLTRRGAAQRELEVPLEDGWRMRADISSRAGTWPMRAMALGGLKLDRLPAVERQSLRLPAGSMALRVHHLGQYGAHAAAKHAGFQKGDVLVAVDGISGDPSEGELIGRILAGHPGKTALGTTVLRGEKRVQLMLPVQ